MIRPYLWTILWALIVLVLCLLPPKDLNGLPVAFDGADKLVHTGFFFVFSVLLFHASTHISHKKGQKMSIQTKGFTLLRVVLISVFFAFFTEFLQWKVFTYRTADLWDLVANGVGIGMGAFAYLLFNRIH